ncbi:DUF397 domain-containing protein [Solihabitans fulvus]|uniref:DUF397 domain-containing protein n=1 Tax=Solihabitans fulvus TaxID=1892852 RepID=A0A5B2XDN5_9PSEU|nr:DUF397 domain-containing protein [Solihabitans fulvus]KAA2261336.1 DUF397 domain-containing protein [Solihabitans fulvus]
MTKQPWRKSSHSGNANACVELAVSPSRTRIRDTKNRDGGRLDVGAAGFERFLGTVKSGRLDLQY